jgi:GxxExxY protein
MKPLELVHFNHGCRPRRVKACEVNREIIGVFYEVYNELGYGFLESVYEESLLIALRDAGLAVEHKFAIPVWFRGGHEVGRFRGTS